MTADRPTDSQDAARQDPSLELQRLLELAAKYPEIGPPLADLAFKIGHADVGDKVVRMGLERGTPGVEFYFVAASAARRERRYADALSQTVEAVKSLAAAADDKVAPDDGTRLLHLVRLGFTTLMFDLKDVNAAPEFAKALGEALPKLEARLGADPFFRALLAQTLWYADKERSEAEWERAVETGEPEHTWNARGTWYKEAEHDLEKAEGAYRTGLEKVPGSALLLHNLGGLLADRAALPDTDVGQARRLLREADEALRNALRDDAAKGLRRHIHGTRDRVHALRAALPQQPKKDGGGGGGDKARAEAPAEPTRIPTVGEVLTGRICSVTTYGAFVALGGGVVGLLHKTELAHEFVHDPAALVKLGDEIEVKVVEVQPGGAGGRLRVGLSRRALLPEPPRAETRGGERGAPRDRGGPRPQGGPDRRDRQDRHDRGGGPRRTPDAAPTPEVKKLLDGKLTSLGEMLLQKLKEQQGKS